MSVSEERCRPTTKPFHVKLLRAQASLAARHALYIQAQQRHPARWSGNTRDWTHIGVVTLNPERDTVVNMAANALHTPQKAA
jgi:putative transposase